MPEKTKRQPVIGDELWLVLTSGELRRCVVEDVYQDECFEQTFVDLVLFNPDGTNARRRNRVSVWDSSETGPGHRLYWNFVEAVYGVTTLAEARELMCRKRLEEAKKRTVKIREHVANWFEAGMVQR